MCFPIKTNVVALVKNSDKEIGYIFGDNKNYIVPEYQREYSWSEEQIESFIESIKHAVKGEQVFMGTVQFKKEKNGMHIIDGQQRMTTFLLLCSLIEKQTGKNILLKNNMSLSIKNFESNNAKLEEALAIKYEEIDRAEYKGNRYIENIKLLKNAIEGLKLEDIDGILTSIFENVYFVELTTENIPLPQVVGIFNTINTTGLDLNCSDLFKLQYYEYLTKNYNKDDWMTCICGEYEKINRENLKNDNAFYLDMSHVLDIYKICIVAKLGLGWDKLSKSNESFYEEIFADNEECDREETKNEILNFEEFKKIVSIYIELSKRQNLNNLKAEYSFAMDIIGMTRYGRYWTIPYAITYFRKTKDYNSAFKTAMSIAKYLVVCSVNFDKAINPVHTFMCNDVLPSISKNKKIEERINDIICESPYEWRNEYPDWNKEEFIKRIKNSLFYNGKRARIICTVSALLEEIEMGTENSEIRAKLFDWKNFQYDLEHIYARERFEKTDPKNISEYNGIGNLVVLNSSINRSMGDKTVADKVKEYKDSPKYNNEPSLVSVKKVAEQIENANNSWGIEQVRERQKEQVELLCDFLGLNS